METLRKSFNPYFTGSTTSTRNCTRKFATDLLRFNPYFTGSTTSTQLCNLSFSRLLQFQSLFYWKYHFNFHSQPAPVRQQCIKVFQSLFYWKYHFNSIATAYDHGRCGVSILILLEVPLQRDTMPKMNMCRSCFNPYFTGSTTSTNISRLIRTGWGKCFNPYFTGSTTSTHRLPVRKQRTHQFQSLFYWKYHFNLKYPRTSCMDGRCFNPYFTGSTTSTCCIQYFFSLPDLSFNPYFTGSTTSTFANLQHSLRRREFQSLFYWKYHFNQQQ